MPYEKKDRLFLRDLGYRIRRAREALGISQEEFAFRCGLHRTYVSDVERGARNISVLKLRDILEELEVGVEDLFPSS